MFKIKNITYTVKEYWNASKLISITNLFLAEDWNKFKIIDTCLSTILTLSSVLDEVFNGNISGTLIDKTNEIHPSTSYLSTINNMNGVEAITGISSIKLNNETYTGSFSAYYLSTGTSIVNTFNDLTGDLTCLTGVKINGTTLSDSSINLGNYFSNDDRLITSINNGYTGEGERLAGSGIVPTALVINEVTLNDLNNNYLINLDLNLDSKFYRKILTIGTPAYIPSANVSEYNIINMEMLVEQQKCSAVVNAGTNTIDNVLDWICITDQNYNKIIPTNIKLVGNTLTFYSPSAGIIYFISNI